MLGIGGLGHLGLQIARAMGAEVIALTVLRIEAGARPAAGGPSRAAGHGPRVWQAAARTGRSGCGRLDDHGLSDHPRCDGRPVAAGNAGFGQLDSRSSADRSANVCPRAAASDGHVSWAREFNCRTLLQLAVLHGIRPLVEQYPLEQVNEVQQRLRENKVQFRAVLEPDGMMDTRTERRRSPPAAGRSATLLPQVARSRWWPGRNGRSTPAQLARLTELATDFGLLNLGAEAGRRALGGHAEASVGFEFSSAALRQIAADQRGRGVSLSSAGAGRLRVPPPGPGRRPAERRLLAGLLWAWPAAVWRGC